MHDSAGGLKLVLKLFSTALLSTVHGYRDSSKGSAKFALGYAPDCGYSQQRRIAVLKTLQKSKAYPAAVFLPICWAQGPGKRRIGPRVWPLSNYTNRNSTQLHH